MDTIVICNMAIGFVGGSRIMSLSDETVEAEQCALYFDTARAFCLESRDWTFASGFRQLAHEPVSAPAEFAYRFPLPADCLVVRVVSANPDLRHPLTYQKEGTSLIADSSTMYIKYTKDITDTTLFSPSFVTAVAHKLGEFIATVLTGDKVMKRTLMQETEAIVDGSGAIDGMQGSPKRAYASRLLNARFRSGRYGLGNEV